jgi:hypothetical protein
MLYKRLYQSFVYVTKARIAHGRELQERRHLLRVETNRLRLAGALNLYRVNEPLREPSQSGHIHPPQVLGGAS